MTSPIEQWCEENGPPTQHDLPEFLLFGGPETPSTMNIDGVDYLQLGLNEAANTMVLMHPTTMEIIQRPWTIIRIVDPE